MNAADAVELYTFLEARGVQLWIDGGWGVDALLGQQTRPHKDLDALVRFDDLLAMGSVLAEQGFDLKEIWSENRWVSHAMLVPLIGRETPIGHEVATAFVIKDAEGREIDVHALRIDATGHGVPAWDSDVLFPAEALDGRGTIAGTPVRCLSAAMHMTTHTGYTLLPKDMDDLRSLHERFGVPYHAENAHLFNAAESQEHTTGGGSNPPPVPG